MRELSASELTCVAGGYDPYDANPNGRLIGEVIVWASRNGPAMWAAGRDILGRAIAGQLLEDYMEEQKKAKIAEDEKILKLEIQKEIDARLSRGEVYTEFVVKIVHGNPIQGVLKFANGPTYIDDDLDGIYDRRE